MRRLKTKPIFLIMITTAIFVLAAGPALACSENSKVGASNLESHASTELNEVRRTKIIAERKSENGFSYYNNGLPLFVGIVLADTNLKITTTAVLTVPDRHCCGNNGCAACQGCCGLNGMCASSCTTSNGAALSPLDMLPTNLKRASLTYRSSNFHMPSHNVEPGIKPPRG